jgi:hypothetical protein
VIRNRAFLPNQLIQAVVCHDAVSLRVGVYSMVLSGSLAVNGHTKANRLPIGSRAEHKMQVTIVETEHNLSATRLEFSALILIDPLGQRL